MYYFLFERCSYRRSGRERQSPIYWFTPQMVATTKAGWSEALSQELLWAILCRFPMPLAGRWTGSEAARTGTDTCVGWCTTARGFTCLCQCTRPGRMLRMHLYQTYRDLLLLHNAVK